jgi:HK97 family phage major capsid protein
MFPELKDALAGIRQTVETFGTRQTEMQRQLDAVDSRGQARIVAQGQSGDGLTQFKSALTENKEALDKHGRIKFDVPTFLGEIKSTVLSTNLTSTEPASGVQGLGRYAYKLRSLFRSVPTLLPTIGVLRATSETLNVSPQVEGQPKGESTMAFNLVQVPVQVFASWITCSKQAMADLDSFGAFIDATLLWALEKKAESEIIFGDGTGVNLPGLATYATAFDPTILSGLDGYNRVDMLGAAATQLAELGWSPDFAVVSPRSWFRMVSLRGTTGYYVLGSPQTTIGERVYSLQVVPSPAMVGDGFLVGDSSKAIIRQRTTASVEVSYEHASNFVSNLCTILAEERFGIEVLRPDAYVQGSLSSSPA